MSYNLVNPTTGALTKVSGNISSNIIPANASAHNKLVAASDTVKRISYNISGTTDAIADTKALVNHILTLDSGSYIGEFKRTGITFGSFRLTYFVDGDGSISVSGTVTYSISNNNDATYQVSYVLSNGSATPYWNIEKLVVARENNFTYQVLTTDSDLNAVTTSGAYSIYLSDATSQATNHAPTYGWLQLIVIQMNNSQSFCNQILCSADGKMFTRECGNGSWTAWKQVAANTVQSGTSTIPAQTLHNLESAEVTIPLTVNDFYCGRVDFANLPSVNMNLSYNDFSGAFQDARETVSRSQFVLYPIGKAYSGTLHLYLTNYTGADVAIGNVQVVYYLEHHSS